MTCHSRKIRRLQTLFQLIIKNGQNPAFSQHGRSIKKKPADVRSASLQLCSGQAPIPKCLHGIVPHSIASGIRCHHVQIILCANHRCRILSGILLHRADLRPPVCHHNTFKAPLLPENGGQKIIAAGIAFAVQRIVGGHNRAGSALLHRDFKALQVNLTQSSRRHQRLNVIAVFLLIVAGKMLDGSGGSVARHPLKLCACHFSGKERILGKILKVPPIQRMPVKIHARPQKRFNPVSSKLHALIGIQLFHQCCVKRRSQGRPARHGKGDCPAVHPDPAGSVRAAADRNSHFLQMFRHSAEGTGRSGRHLRRAHSFSPHNRAQIFIRELRDKIRKKSLSLCNVRKTDSYVSGIRKLFRNSLRTSVRRNHRSRRHRLF